MIDTNKTLQVVDETTSPPETPPVARYLGKRKLFVAAGIVQVAILLGLAYAPMTTLAHGRVVTFDTIPVDPWDMFRGDYVTLSYAFSTVATPERFFAGQRVYTVLRKDTAEKWQAVRVTPDLPVLNDNEIMLAGKAEPRSGDSVQVRYGIEQAFVAEGRGRDVQSGEGVEAEVAVSANGHAVIKEVRHNKDILYRWRLF